jgi:sugar transferase (PEP-CTERM/EpsH1 system associated)
MNVLLIAEYFPYPPDNGAKIRTWYLLKGLCQAHKVTLASFLHQGENDREAITEVSRYCDVLVCPPPPEIPLWRKSINAFSLTPLGVWRRSSSLLKSVVDGVVQKHSIQVLMVEELWMSQYVLDLPIYKVIDKLNIEFVRAYRRLHTLTSYASPLDWIRWLVYRGVALRLKRYELNVVSRFNRVIVCSENDAELLLKYAKKDLNVEVVPNGVDIDYFTPDPKLEDESKNIIVYTGAFMYEPNVDAVFFFVQQILPVIYRAFPDARFVIVGSDPPSRLARLSDLDPRIVVTGYVSDIRPFLARAKVFVVPLRMGSGTRLKILQAMAMGKAIVSTTIGCEGIAAKNGEHLLIADSPFEFAQAVIKLLKDETLRRKLGKQARLLAQREYAWQKSQAKLLSIFENIKL